LRELPQATRLRHLEAEGQRNPMPAEGPGAAATEGVVTTRELCQRFGITPRMLQWWCDNRLVRFKTIPDSRGNPRIFDDAQALTAAVIWELRSKGVSLHRITKLKLATPTGDFLVTDTRTALYCTAEEILPAVAAAPGGCFVVSLYELRQRLNGKPKARKAHA
jgi:DNA-binding transcriptional MerR regulator